MKKLLLLISSIICLQSYCQTKVSDIANISIDVPLGYHYIEDWERKQFDVNKNVLAFVSETARESFVVDIRSLLGLINDDVLEFFHHSTFAKDNSTPLKQKLFQNTDDYKSLIADFVDQQHLLNNNPICFKIDLKKNLSDYDLQSGGFYIKIPFLWTAANRGYSGPVKFPWNFGRDSGLKFEIPEPILKKHFKTDIYASGGMTHNTFYTNVFLAKVCNENMALAIEDSKANDNDFAVVILTHIVKDKLPKFVVDDIILYHKPTEYVIWSVSKGDLSKDADLSND